MNNSEGRTAQSPHSPAPTGIWTTGLFGCFEDPGNCCMTIWCPSVTISKNVEILDKGRTSFGCLYPYTYRTKLRRLYSLPEEPCKDFCVHCWCGNLAICQEYRELKNRGLDPSLGWTANEERLNTASQTPPSFPPGMTR